MNAKCPKCQKERDAIIIYYYKTPRGHEGRDVELKKVGGLMTLRGNRPALWYKTEFVCSKHGIVYLTLDDTMNVRG